MNAPVLDLLLFAVLPYLALFVFFLVTIARYRNRPFTYSSLSSQFLENHEHFFGLVSFHYGILAVLFAHLLGLLIPRQIILWNSRPLRLYVLEWTGLSLGLLALIGVIAVLHRRFAVLKARMVTSVADWIVLALLLVQAATGVYTAVFRPWGSNWYAISAVPYLRSLFFFRPDVSYLATMPWPVKLHMTNAWMLATVFPFTRLVHALVAPFPYLWRKPEVVRWYGVRLLPERAPCMYRARG